MTQKSNQANNADVQEESYVYGVHPERPWSDSLMGVLMPDNYLFSQKEDICN